MDQSSCYEFVEQQADHHFRTEIPNIIFELGLDNDALVTYFMIKRICGENGACWKTAKNLCDCCNIGETKLRSSLQILSQNFEVLGQPLIKISHRMKADGSRDSNLITILNIWRENGDYFRNKKINKGTSRDEGGVPRGTRGGTSRREDKEEPIQEVVVVVPRERETDPLSGTEATNVDQESKPKAAAPEKESIKLEECMKLHMDGHEFRVTKDDMFRASILRNKHWTKEEIDEAWMEFCKSRVPLRDHVEFFGGIVHTLRVLKQNKSINIQKKEETKWKPKNQRPEPKSAIPNESSWKNPEPKPSVEKSKNINKKSLDLVTVMPAYLRSTYLQKRTQKN